MICLISVLATELPEHFEKSLEITLKHLDSATTILTLLLGATAYLASKQLLDVPKDKRPSVIWLALPIVPSAGALFTTLFSYSKMEDSLSMASPEDFLVWWQYARVGLVSLLVLTVLMLAISFIRFSRR